MDLSALSEELETLLAICDTGGPDERTLAPVEEAEKETPAKKSHRSSQRRRSRRKDSRSGRRGFFAAACWLLALFFIFQFLVGVTVLSGSSMRPALLNGDILIYRRFGIDQVNRGDILVIRNDGGRGTAAAKRVIAIGGDTISVDVNGYVTLNGKPLKESEILYGYQPQDGWLEFPVTVKEGEYFYLGDNRPVSLDSRMASVGTGTMNQVQGKVLAVLRTGR